MRLWPRSLLWRSVVLIALLLVIANLAWVQIFRVAERTPRARQAAQQIASVVNITRWALISSQPSKRFELLSELSQTEGVQVYVAAPKEQLAPLPDRPFLNEVVTELRKQLGPDTRITLTRSGVRALWVSFRIDQEEYWVMLPRSRIERNDSQRWAWWGVLVLVLSVGGAYFFVSLINRPLRQLTRAAGLMGRGRMPQPVTEEGPSEISTVAHAFNEMAADLKRLDDERALLLAGVSHDLRTPLSRIRLGVEMMDDKGDAALRSGLIQDIEDIDVSIGQFLDFARLRDSEEPRPNTSLNAVVQAAVSRYAKAGRAVAFRPGPVPTMPLRLRAMQRLISNLIENALKHGSPTVDIVTGHQDGVTYLEVLDRGPGIPEEEAERMLQPFTRLDAARGGSGTGLGLAIVDRIAQLHGGSVSLMPREGGGLRARVEFPLGE